MRRHCIRFYDKDGARFVMNASSLPETKADHEDQRTYYFLTEDCVENNWVEHKLVHRGGSDFGYDFKVLDEAAIIAAAKKEGIETL